MGGKSDAPAGPDYSALLQQQTGANRDMFGLQTQTSRPEQTNPYGSVNWENNKTFNQGAYDRDVADYDRQYADWLVRNNGTGEGNNNIPFNMKRPDTTNSAYTRDNWKQTTTLSPDQQALLDKREGVANTALDQARQSRVDLPEWQGPVYDTGTRDKYVADSLEAFRSRNDPDVALQRERQHNRLTAQGISTGSDAYAEQDRLQGRREDDALLQAKAQAQTTGDAMLTNEQNRAMQVAQARYGAGTSQAKNSQAEQMRMLSAALQAANGGAPPTTGTVATPGINAPDAIAAANSGFQNQLGAYNADTAKTNGMYSGLAALAMAAATAYSDRRLKKDIVKTDSVTKHGFQLYLFRYLWEDSDKPLNVGVMADEVELTMPMAVMRDKHGYARVDYSMVM